MKEIKIKIGSQEIGFSFGLAFLGEFLDVTDLSLEEISVKVQKNPFKMVPLIMLHSSLAYSERHGLENNHTIFTMGDLIDENGGVSSDAVLVFLKAFTKSMIKGVPKDEGYTNPVDVKKK